MSNTEPTQSSAWGTRGTAGATFAGDVTVEQVSHVVNRKTIIDTVSLHFPAGKVSCLLGPSGCGKTTILRLIAGISRPTSGRILLDHLEVASATRFVPPEHRNVGLVFQDFALFTHMSVLQNVMYGLYALSRSDAVKAAMRALERVGLASYADMYPHQLSGGEQQRVALARAIVPRPQVILLDEPFSGLDQRLREQVRAETLAVIRETRATAILVTHDPEEAIEVADQIHVLRQGRVVQSGTPRELVQRPIDVRVAQFFGPGALLKGPVKSGLVDTPLGLFKAAALADGSTADILVRPQAIKLGKTRNGIAAYVSDVRFMGETQKLTLHILGLEHPVEALVDVRTVIASGQEVQISIDHKGVFVFKSTP